MTPHSDDAFLDDFDALPDAVEVYCPYCGVNAHIEVDPTGGSHQDYVEDCPVCCRPWGVRVRVDSEGVPWVDVQPIDDL